MSRESLLSAGMMEPAERTVHGIRLRPFSYGSIQLAYMLDLTLFTDDAPELALSDAETQRQIVSFAWLQSAPEAEVVNAVIEKRTEECILRYALGIPFSAIPELLDEVTRIASMIRASNVRVESRHKPSSEEEPPGKS